VNAGGRLRLLMKLGGEAGEGLRGGREATTGARSGGL
jgi:hypothetical protein